MRDLKGRVPIAEVLNAGVERVITEDGSEIRAGMIETGDKLRPALRNGRPTLYVRPVETGIWEALKV